MKTYLLLVVAFVSATSAFSESTQPDKQDFIEIGGGVSMVDVPHYAGSDQSFFYFVPFPFFVYQSDKVSLNREGLRRHIKKTQNWDFDISFGGTLPLDSEDNRAREGMPDLDWVALGGPSVNYRFHSDSDTQFYAKLPLHLGVATDFTQLDYVGWEFVPTLRLEQTFEQQDTTWRMVSSLSYFYGSQKHNDYYYSVAPEFATLDRPAYQADAGSGGYQGLFGVTRRQGKFWTGAFLRYRTLADAEFRDSPLVRQQDNWYVGLAFAWIAYSTK